MEERAFDTALKESVMWEELIKYAKLAPAVIIAGAGERGHAVKRVLLEYGISNTVFANSEMAGVRKSDVLTIKEAVRRFPGAVILVSVQKGSGEFRAYIQKVLEEECTVDQENDMQGSIFVLNDMAEEFQKISEPVFYRDFHEKLLELAEISRHVKPANREDCFDRYYINDYVERNKRYIKGDVLEFAGGEIYAEKYGQPSCVKLMTSPRHREINPTADYFADLDDKSTLPEEKFDCIIATQVIMYVNDLETALENLRYMLKPDGALILTVPGPLFHHSKNSHHMFSFTEESLKYLCDRVFHNYEDFMWYGSLEYAMYMLFWMKKNPCEKPTEHEYLYTLVMGITAKNQ